MRRRGIDEGQALRPTLGSSMPPTLVPAPCVRRLSKAIRAWRDRVETMMHVVLLRACSVPDDSPHGAVQCVWPARGLRGKWARPRACDQPAGPRNFNRCGDAWLVPAGNSSPSHPGRYRDRPALCSMIRIDTDESGPNPGHLHRRMSRKCQVAAHETPQAGRARRAALCRMAGASSPDASRTITSWRKRGGCSRSMN